ncbi:MAG TPA: Flp family type IVb pilin [Pirellulales bacterium]
MNTFNKQPITRSISRFFAQEDGATMVEYGLMLALVVIVCLTAVTLVGTNTRALFELNGNALANSLGG